LTAGIAVAAFMAVPGGAHAAGPTAIAVDSNGTSYVGYASGAVTRVSAPGSQLPRWTTPVADASGSLGAIMAIDVAPSESNPNAGNVWVLDSNRRVQEFTRDGSFVRGFRIDACDGGNSPEPGREGGLYLTTQQIYVAHPCGDRIMRFPISSLPATGTANVSPAATNQNVFAPHGIGGPDSSFAGPAPYEALYVALPKEESIRWFGLGDLSAPGPPVGNPIPGLTKSGPTEDVFVLNSSSTPRIYFADAANDDVNNRHRIFAAEATFAAPPFDGTNRPFDEIFNFGGLGTGQVQFDDPVAFDVLATTAPASTHVIVADRRNERIQRVTAQQAPPGPGNFVWEAGAVDPGPPPAAPGGTTPGGGGSGTGAGAGTTQPAGGSPGAGGTVGVTIEGGARYTNSPYVELTVREPAGTTAVEISNGSAFTDKDTRAVQTSLGYEWTLEQGGSDQAPRTVYVRFPGSGSDRVYSDDIVLDRKAPLVGAATLSPKGKKRGKKGRRWLLRVAADDEVAGVDQVHLAKAAGGPYESRDFADRITVRREDRPRFVRVTDFAGNVSPPVSVSRRGR
jgi:hypothetical protein